jgi:hypothetical protein
MRMSVSTLFSPLPSVCLRYNVAMPSVWPRRMACKQRQYSHFHSDSPLNLTSCWLGFENVGDAFRARPFIRMQLTACSLSTYALRSSTTANFCASPSSSCFRCSSVGLEVWLRVNLRLAIHTSHRCAVRVALGMVLFRRMQPATTPTHRLVGVR